MKETGYEQEQGCLPADLIIHRQHDRRGQEDGEPEEQDDRLLMQQHLAEPAGKNDHESIAETGCGARKDPREMGVVQTQPAVMQNDQGHARSCYRQRDERHALQPLGDQQGASTATITGAV